MIFCSEFCRDRFALEAEHFLSFPVYLRLFYDCQNAPISRQLGMTSEKEKSRLKVSRLSSANEVLSLSLQV